MNPFDAMRFAGKKAAAAPVLAAQGQTYNTSTGNKQVVISAPANAYIVVFGAGSGSAGSGTPTDNQSGAYTLKGNNNDGNFWSSIWVRTTQFVAGGSITITSTNSADTGGGLTVLCFTGVQAGGGVRKYGVGMDTTTAGSTPTLGGWTFAGNALSNSCIVGQVLDVGGTGTTPAEPSGFSALLNTSYITPSVGIRSCTKASGYTGNDLTWGGACTSGYVCPAVEVNPTTTT